MNIKVNNKGNICEGYERMTPASTSTSATATCRRPSSPSPPVSPPSCVVPGCGSAWVTCHRPVLAQVHGQSYVRVLYCMSIMSTCTKYFLSRPRKSRTVARCSAEPRSPLSLSSQVSKCHLIQVTSDARQRGQLVTSLQHCTRRCWCWRRCYCSTANCYCGKQSSTAVRSYVPPLPPGPAKCQSYVQCKYIVLAPLPVAPSPSLLPPLVSCGSGGRTPTSSSLARFTLTHSQAGRRPPADSLILCNADTGQGRAG